MNQKPAISDDPLPEGELVDPAQAVAENNASTKALTPVDPHTLAAAGTDDALHDPELHRFAVGEPQDPELHSEERQSLSEPQLDVAPMPVTVVNDPVVNETVVTDVTKTQAITEHMTQVGLTSSDQWEAHFQPRIQKLAEDIALVHVELDKLERKKFTK